MIDETSSKLGARNNREEILGEDKARGAKLSTSSFFVSRRREKGKREGHSSNFIFPLPFSGRQSVKLRLASIYWLFTPPLPFWEEPVSGKPSLYPQEGYRGLSNGVTRHGPTDSMLYETRTRWTYAAFRDQSYLGACAFYIYRNKNKMAGEERRG